jgi:uncharacterized protein (TIGR02147 family)
MLRNKSTIVIFDYTDYRQYLEAFYREQKARNPGFSYRSFAIKARISSVGLYKDVVNGRQRLSRRVVSKFSEAMGHSKREAEYFEAMVFFSDAKTVDERKLYFSRMMECHESRARKVEASQYEYYSCWYYSAVRALLSFYRFDGADFESLGRKLSPPIRAPQARKAIEVLEKVDMIRKNAAGVYEPCDQIVTTGNLECDRNVQSLNVITMQKNFNTLASEAFDRYSAQQMDMSTVTVSVSRHMLRTIKDELAAFRKKLLSLAEKDPNPECVYQLNCHFYPLTDPGKDEQERGR